MAGAGHSFPPVAATNDILVSLADYRGLVSTNQAAGEATVRAGTTIGELNEALAAEGLALRNMGDVDRQSIAGALATGTHGTGAEFGVLANQIVSLRLVTATGAVHELTPADGDRFRAAQVPLGALGVVTTVTLDVVPAYHLREVEQPMSVEDALTKIEGLRDTHRNVEFFWFPNTDTAVVKILNKVEEDATRGAQPGGNDHTLSQSETGSFIDPTLEERFENTYWEAACRVGSHLPRTAPWLSRLTTGLITESTRSGPSHDIYPSTRAVRFEETEYGVPAEAGVKAFRAVADRIERDYPDTMFPVEFRYVRGDDILISPAYGRDSAFIAVHRYHRKSHRACLQACGEVLQHHNGRPHWGKRHWLNSDGLSDIYPKWDTFQAIRREFDPDGLFLNEHLRSIISDP